jgi:hypothetical protein
MSADDEQLIRTVFEGAAGRRSNLSGDVVHDDALVMPHVDPPVALSKDEIIRFVDDRQRNTPMYEAHAHEIRRVGNGRYVVVGRTRISRGASGFVDTAAAWAIVVKDGKLFRVKGTSTAEEALLVLRTDDWTPGPC